MKRYLMTCGLMTLLASVSFSVMGEEPPANVTINGVTYKTVEVNGQRYYMKDSGNSTRNKRSADNSSVEPGLFKGDVLLRNSIEPEHKISGGILIEVSEPEAQELAQRYGLELGRQVGGIALLKASASTDLNQLAARLRQEGYQVQIEVSAPLNRPN
ncbi:hypothetical protein WG219_01855 [Ectopseudomonas mendocina]|uniref:ASP external chaperone domain-containing protein n=1 Tax=Ectopseudomonas mendocina TaxID=300 RepID=A0ABZ2RKW4_ECTME